MNAGVVENDRQEICNCTNEHPVEIFEDDLYSTVIIIGCGVSHVSLGDPGFDIERRVSEYADSSLRRRLRGHVTDAVRLGW